MDIKKLLNKYSSIGARNIRIAKSVAFTLFVFLIVSFITFNITWMSLIRIDILMLALAIYFTTIYSYITNSDNSVRIAVSAVLISVIYVVCSFITSGNNYSYSWVFEINKMGNRIGIIIFCLLSWFIIYVNNIIKITLD